MHCVRAPDRVGARLGQAQMPHMPGPDQVGDGTHRVLDRYRRVDPSGPVDVDMVGAQALQAVGQEVLDRGRSAVEADEGPARVEHGPELDREHRCIAPALDGPRDQRLVVAHAVEVAGVEQVDAGVEAAWIVATLSTGSAGP